MGRLRGKLKYRPVVFELMPPEFTLLELQRTVEAISGTLLHKQNFRRLVEQGGLVETDRRMSRPRPAAARRSTSASAAKSCWNGPRQACASSQAARKANFSNPNRVSIDANASLHETPAKISRPFRGWYWFLLLPGIAALMLLSQPTLPDTRTVKTEAGPIKVETVAKGLDHPWGLAFLPDGDMLVTEKSGTLRRVAKDGTMSKPLSGVPEVVAKGRGDCSTWQLTPTSQSNRLVYLSYSEPGEGGSRDGGGARQARRQGP